MCSREREQAAKYHCSPTSELLQPEVDILRQVKYIVIYEGYGVTIFMLLLAGLDFEEKCNVRPTPCTAVLFPGYTVAAHYRLFWVVCRESSEVVPAFQFSLDEGLTCLSL